MRRVLHVFLFGSNLIGSKCNQDFPMSLENVAGYTATYLKTTVGPKEAQNFKHLVNFTDVYHQSRAVEEVNAIASVPSSMPSSQPSSMPSSEPSKMPSFQPSFMPSSMPSVMPSFQPSSMPSSMPSVMPSFQPSSMPSSMPSVMPSFQPSELPSAMPSEEFSSFPSSFPSASVSFMPSNIGVFEPECCGEDGPSEVLKDGDEWKCAVELYFPPSDEYSINNIKIEGTVTTSFKKGVLGSKKTKCKTKKDGKCILKGKKVKTVQGGKTKKPGIDYCVFIVTSIETKDKKLLPLPSSFNPYNITVADVLAGRAGL